MTVEQKTEFTKNELKEEISRLKYLINNGMLFKWELPVHHTKINELEVQLENYKR